MFSSLLVIYCTLDKRQIYQSPHSIKYCPRNISSTKYCWINELCACLKVGLYLSNCGISCHGDYQPISARAPLLGSVWVKRALCSCQPEIYDGKTIFGRQINVLSTLCVSALILSQPLDSQLEYEGTLGLWSSLLLIDHVL